MIKKLFPLFIITLVACDKEATIDYEDHHNIAMSIHVDGILQDSLTYYYDGDNRLQNVSKCNGPEMCSGYNVYYHPDYISNWNGNYTLDSNSKVVLIENSGNKKILEYQSNKLTYKREMTNDFLAEEKFYKYQNSNLIKDSTVIYHQNDTNYYSTVNYYSYTNLIKPEFVVDYSGLYEMPATNDLLTSNVQSVFYVNSARLNSTMIYKYQYEIFKDRLIQTVRISNGDNNYADETWTTKYWYRKN